MRDMGLCLCCFLARVSRLLCGLVFRLAVCRGAMKSARRLTVVIKLALKIKPLSHSPIMNDLPILNLHVSLTKGLLARQPSSTVTEPVVWTTRSDVHVEQDQPESKHVDCIIVRSRPQNFRGHVYWRSYYALQGNEMNNLTRYKESSFEPCWKLSYGV